MSILGSSNNSEHMGAPFFHQFKKQASFFFKEKIKTARLALTDVTPAQLLAEEATNANPWAPDTRTLKMISKAAFEVDDYWRIVEILHNRLVRFDRENWRLSYKALIVLEHLLTHGPESVAEEFQSDKDVIREMGSFQHLDEKGFNWGLNVRNKSERILKLLERGSLLKEERDRARKLTRGIEGFGSFCQRTSSAQVLQESSIGTYGSCDSQFSDNGNQDQFSSLNYEDLTKKGFEKSHQTDEENDNLASSKKMENSNSRNGSSDGEILGKFCAKTSFKENMVPGKVMAGDLPENCMGELKPLLVAQKDDPCTGISVDHPFSGTENLSRVSLLSEVDQLLQAC
ncbi:ENTH domain-containing protein C794.11c-like [Cornus florida]|uniref:ENTH domain-containing protein C794.11c-like n=1 Tax=Cornus florida TaxID=4283 RepID=UPI002899FE3F|nr:ENTH domain-containing protein C794.11c-like [Cornus florida]